MQTHLTESPCLSMDSNFGLPFSKLSLIELISCECRHFLHTLMRCYFSWIWWVNFLKLIILHWPILYLLSFLHSGDIFKASLTLKSGH